jgi:hypothetical protein
MNCSIFRLRACALFLVPACIAWNAGSAPAVVLKYLSLDDQCDRAEVIVVATAGSRSSFWAENNTIIYTDTRFEVEETVKGSVSGSVAVRQIGGQVGDLAQNVAGTPDFVTGERYVLFLSARADGLFRVVGFSQGCYPVVVDPGGKARVKPNLASSSGSRVLGSPSGKALSGRSLDEFLAQLRFRLNNKR